MSVYPGAIPPNGTAVPANTLAVAQHTSLHNVSYNEIGALATKLGTGASTPTSGTVLRGTGVGTSGWGQAVLTTDVTGTLPIANGGTGQASLTGLTLPSAILNNPAISGTVPGGATYTAPTLTAPTVTGGQTVDNLIVTSGTTLPAGDIGFADLLSTIFSGQLLSQANAGGASGTMYYINLGGIKLLWAVSTGQTVNTNLTYSFTLPVGFFSTVTSAYASPQCATGVVYGFVLGLTTTTLNTQAQTTGSQTVFMNALIIGT